MQLCTAAAQQSTITDVMSITARYAKNNVIDTERMERDIKNELLERKPATKFNKHQHA